MSGSNKDDEVFVAGADIGGTKVSVALASYRRILVQLYQVVRLTGESTVVPLQVDSLIERACREARVRKEQICSLGVSTASPFVMVDGYREVCCPNLCGGLAPDRGLLPNCWCSIPLEEILSPRFSTVAIANDCVAAAVAEHLFGAGIGVDDMVQITWSTGIGAGLIVDGRVLRGKNGNAGHGGHIYMLQDGPKWGCGKLGDLESVASGVAIARDYGGRIDAAEVFAQFRSGTPRAVEIVLRAARTFARGLASMNALLDTKLFVIGGGVFMNNQDLLLPLIREEFARSFPALSSGTKIVPCALGGNLANLGALSLVLPETWIADWKELEPWKNAPAVITVND